MGDSTLNSEATEIYHLGQRITILKAVIDNLNLLENSDQTYSLNYITDPKMSGGTLS